MILFAAEGAVDLDMWAGIASAIFYLGLAYFAGPTLLSALRGRQRSIVESLEKAEVARREAEALRQKQEAARARIKVEADALLVEGKRDAAALRTELLEQAAVEIERLRQRNSRDIALATQRALTEIALAAVDRSTFLAERTLRSALQADDQKRLVDETIAEFGALPQEVA